MTINVMFAVGQNGEFGRTAEFTNQLLGQAEGDDLRYFPRNGLPWNCKSDMAFFRTMTLGMHAASLSGAYSDLVESFKHTPDKLRSLLAMAWSDKCEDNVVMAGSETFFKMRVHNSGTRIFVPISRKASEEYADGTMPGLITYAESTSNATIWIVGGKSVLETVMADHAAGKIKIDNMFISCIKNPGPSDVVIDCAKLTAYIDSNFTYNTEESIENNEVLIVRYRGINK